MLKYIPILILFSSCSWLLQNEDVSIKDKKQGIEVDIKPQARYACKGQCGFLTARDGRSISGKCDQNPIIITEERHCNPFNKNWIFTP